MSHLLAGPNVDLGSTVLVGSTYTPAGMWHVDFGNVVDSMMEYDIDVQWSVASGGSVGDVDCKLMIVLEYLILYLSIGRR